MDAHNAGGRDNVKHVRGVAGFLFAIIIALFSFTVSSCNDDGNSSKRVNEFQENHSIIGTWKLIAFVDVKNNTYREPDYYVIKDVDGNSIKDTIKDESIKNTKYLLSFDNDTLLSGFTFNNLMNGSYSINYNTDKLHIQCGAATYIAEYSDGELYPICLNMVETFSFTDKELKLFYNNQKNYLLFNRRNNYEN